jgi:hypothetical protein
MWYRKGPPSAGRPEKETANLTPLPSGAVVASMEPARALPSFSGSVPTYLAPMGLLVTCGAGARVEDWAVTVEAAAKREMIETSIMVVIVEFLHKE